MSEKTKTVILTDGYSSGVVGVTDHYRVERVTDTTEFHIGQMLPKREVDSLCAARDWKVTIVPKDR